MINMSNINFKTYNNKKNFLIENRNKNKKKKTF